METHLPRCYSNNIGAKKKLYQKIEKYDLPGFLYPDQSRSPSEMTASHRRNQRNVLGVATPLKKKLKAEETKNLGKKMRSSPGN